MAGTSRTTDYSLGTYELPDEGEISSEEWERYQQEFEPFRGQKRVWIIFRVDDSETETLLSYLNTIGRQIDIYKQKGAFVCKYQFELKKKEILLSESQCLIRFTI
ncbi:MAG: hypothetical protein WBB43_15245 [Limnoraphis sp.]